MAFGRRRLASAGALLSAGTVAFTAVLAGTVIAVANFGTTPALQLAWPTGSAFNVERLQLLLHTGMPGTTERSYARDQRRVRNRLRAQLQ